MTVRFNSTLFMCIHEHNLKRTIGNFFSSIYLLINRARKMCKENFPDENVPLDTAAVENEGEQEVIFYNFSFILIDNFSFYFLFDRIFRSWWKTQISWEDIPFHEVF